MKLRPYQSEALEAIDKALDDGVTKQLMVIGTGGGKRLWDETDVLTPYGLQRLADLRVGDQIIGSNGAATVILGIYGIGTGPAFKVTFNDGTSVIADGDHLWNVRRNWSDKWHTMSTQQILNAGVTKTTKSNRKNGGYKWYMPLVEPVEHFSNDLLVEPYLLGVLLANGSLTGTSTEFTSNDAYIHEKVSKLNSGLDFQDSTRKIGARKTRINGFMPTLKELELAQVKSREKFIPESYLFSSIEHRKMLLAALMDCDGSAEVNRRASYSSYSFDLAEGVASLVRSLGGVAQVKTKNRSDGDTEFEVTVWTPFNPFSLPRKADLYSPTYNWFKAIESIEPVGEYPMRCLQVDAKDHLYVVENYIVTHNTVCFAHLIKNRGKKTLVLAHREELLEQAKRTIETVNPEIKVAIEQADRHADLEDDVVIASVATLGRASSDRIEKFPEDHFHTLIVDEAHHASRSNQTYWSILDRFDVGLRLGVTATPQRGDNTSLKDAFERIVFFKPMVELIKDGYLVPFIGHRIRTDTDISGVTSRAGDYAVGELSKAVNITERNALIVESYKDIASDSKAVVFCVDVAHAEAVTQEFVDADVAAAYVVGTTPRDKRREILEKFHHGDIKVLVNVGVAVEGFDEPSVETIILARPTKSKVFLTQALGRGTRLFEGKDHCTVIDLCDATKGRSPVTLPTLLGLPPEFDLEGKNAMEILEEYEKLEEEAPEEAASVQSLEDIKAAWDRIDLFTLPPVNEDLLEYTQLTWMELGGGKYVLNVSPEERLTIKEDALGRFAVELKYKGKEYRLGAKDENPNAGLCDSMEEVFQRTDAWIERKHADKLGLLDATAQWRDEKPTEKQLKFFKRNNIPLTTKLTRGQATMMINRHIEENPRPERPKWLENKIRQERMNRKM